MEPPPFQLTPLQPGAHAYPPFPQPREYMSSPGPMTAGTRVTFQFPRLSPAGSTPSRRGLFHTNSPPRWEWLRFHPTTIYSGTRSRAPNYFRGRLTNAPPRQASVSSDERAFSCLIDSASIPCSSASSPPPRRRLASGCTSSSDGPRQKGAPLTDEVGSS